MCCHAETHHPMGNWDKHHIRHGINCGCGIGPQFLSKKKKIEALKKYLAQLREQVEDVEAYIAELQKK
jgi:hypothetical protein